MPFVEYCHESVDMEAFNAHKEAMAPWLEKIKEAKGDIEKSVVLYKEVMHYPTQLTGTVTSCVLHTIRLGFTGDEKGLKAYLLKCRGSL